MTQSHIQDTINKYVRKLDRFLGSQLDTRIDNLLKQKPTPTPAPAPESTNKDKFTDTPPTPPISHIIAVSFDELL